MKRPLRNLLSLLLAMVLLLSLAIPSALAEEETAELTSEVFTVVAAQNQIVDTEAKYSKSTGFTYRRTGENSKTIGDLGSTSFAWLTEIKKGDFLRITFNGDTVVNIALKKAAALVDGTYTLVADESQVTGADLACFNSADNVFTYWSGGKAMYAGMTDTILCDIPHGQSVTISGGSVTGYSSDRVAEGTYTLVAAGGLATAENGSAYLDKTNGTFTYFAGLYQVTVPLGAALPEALASARIGATLRFGPSNTASLLTNPGTSIADGEYKRYLYKSTVNAEGRFYLPEDGDTLTVWLKGAEQSVDIPEASTYPWYSALSGTIEGDAVTFANNAIIYVKIGTNNAGTHTVPDGIYSVTRGNTAPKYYTGGVGFIKRTGQESSYKYSFTYQPEGQHFLCEVTYSAEDSLGGMIYSLFQSNGNKAIRIENNTATLLSSDEAKFTLYGADMALDGVVKVNFYFLAEIASNETSKFSIVSTVEEGNNVRHSVSRGTNTITVPVAIKDMGKNITIQVYKEEELQSIHTSAGDDTSFTINVNTLADRTKEYSTGASLIALMSTMTDYGAAAAGYFNKDADVEAPGEEDISAVQNAVKEMKRSNTKTTEGYTVSPSLVLKDQTYIKYYIKAPDGVTEDTLTVTVGDQTAFLEPTTYNGYQYYCKSAPIPANKLGEMLTLTVRNEDETVYTMEYCPMSYVYSMLGKKETTSPSLKALLVNMYDYYTAAMDYIGN